MNLTVMYDHKADVLFIGTGRKRIDGASLETDMHVIVEYGSEWGYDIVAITVMFASATLAPCFVPRHQDAPLLEMEDNPLASYDEDTDTLTLGAVAKDPTLVSEVGEYIVGYWQRSECDEAYFDIIGVSLRHASKHLEPFFRPVIGDQPAVASE